MEFECYHCGHTVSKKYNLSRHISKMHFSRKKRGPVKVKAFSCLLCELAAPCRNDILSHYTEAHGVQIEKTTLHFQDFAEFNEWRCGLEKSGVAKFVRFSIKKRKYNAIKIYYRCHRDGFYKPEGKGIRSSKKWSHKINGCCPSNMSAHIKDDGVEVKYISTHVGHDKSHLDEEDYKETIAQKLSWTHLPLGRILDEIMDDVVDNESNGMPVFSRKDVCTILWHCDDLKRDFFSRKNDFTCLDDWVNQMRVTTSIIRYYKPEWSVDPRFKCLDPQDFLLIIANDAQIELLKTYGHKFICIDGGRHGMHLSGYELTTIIVIDDLQQGFPCAFLVSNRSELEVLQVFFSVIKSSLERTVSTEILMTDIPDKYLNAWSSVMSLPKRRLFSPWHVDQAWRKNLSKIRTVEKRIEVYRVLRKLLLEKNEDEFKSLLQVTVNTLRANEDTQKFSAYFTVQYAVSPQYWGYCYRKHCESSRNIHLEYIHKTVKYLFLKGKKVKRLDKTLQALLKYSRDNLYYKLTSSRKVQWNFGMNTIKPGHEWANTIKDFMIHKTVDVWTISSIDGREICVITPRASGNCPCLLQCESCDICLHSFKCTCPDSAIEWNICIHIHFLKKFVDNVIRPREMEKLTQERTNSLALADPFDPLTACAKIKPLSISSEVLSSVKVKSEVTSHEEFVRSESTNVPKNIVPELNVPSALPRIIISATNPNSGISAPRSLSVPNQSSAPVIPRIIINASNQNASPPASGSSSLQKQVLPPAMPRIIINAPSQNTISPLPCSSNATNQHPMQRIIISASQVSSGTKIVPNEGSFSETRKVGGANILPLPNPRAVNASTQCAMYELPSAKCSFNASLPETKNIDKQGLTVLIPDQSLNSSYKGLPISIPGTKGAANQSVTILVPNNVSSSPVTASECLLAAGLALANKKDRVFQKCHEILTQIENEEEVDLLMKAILSAKSIIDQKRTMSK